MFIKRLLFVFIILLLVSASVFSADVARKEVGNLVLEDVPEIPEALKERLIQYQNVRSASFRDWQPDGTGIMISTRFGETSQFHFVEKPMGMRKQITFFNEPIGGGSFSPDPNTNGFLFTKDIGGSEANQIFYFDMNKRSYKLLSDGTSRNGRPNWSNKGDKFCYSSTRSNQKDYYIYISDINNPGKAYTVLENKGYWIASDWSPDDSKLLIINYISSTESYYHILDLETKELTQVNPSKEQIAYGGASFSKDGKGVYITCDDETEFQQLHYYDLKTKKMTSLTSHINWNVEGFSLSDDGKFMTYTVNDDAISKLHLLNLKTNKEIKLPEIPIGQIYGVSFSPDNKKFSMVLNTSSTPGDVYIYNLKNKQLTRWTESEVGGLNTDNFSIPELIHYPTFDKVDGKARQIPAFVFKPKGKKGPLPVLISIHGGPEAQYNPYFSSTYQFWANELGIAIIAPNVRGSAGYGKSYLKLDNGFNRENSVKDIGKLLDWIETQNDLDSKKVGVYGGSYGGYMVLASMTNYNDRIACGIDVVGISNFVTFLKNTKEYRRNVRRVEYGDEREPKMEAFLQKIAPINNAHKISKPLFVVQGLNDPRVPASEAEQMVAKIRENKGDVWYMLAKDEGHGFRKKTNRDYYTAAVVLFLEKYLIK